MDGEHEHFLKELELKHAALSSSSAAVQKVRCNVRIIYLIESCATSRD